MADDNKGDAKAPEAIRVLVLSDVAVDGALYSCGSVVEFPAATAEWLVASDYADDAKAATAAAVKRGAKVQVHQAPAATETGEA